MLLELGWQVGVRGTQTGFGSRTIVPVGWTTNS